MNRTAFRSTNILMIAIAFAMPLIVGFDAVAQNHLPTPATANVSAGVSAGRA
jgi:hypothetical protein